MRRTFLGALAIAGCLAAAPAHAFTWAARVGALYGYEDRQAPLAGASSGDRLDLDLGLSLGGYLYRADFLDYSGGVSYRRVDAQGGSRTEERDLLSYRGQVRLFTSRRSPLHVDLRFLRQDDDTLRDDVETFGRRTSFGLDASWADRVHPAISVGYQRDRIKQDVPTLGQLESRLDSFRASTGAGTASYSFNLDYRGALSDGTFVGDKFADHRFDLRASAVAEKDVSVTLQDTFFLRLPTVGDALATRIEFNSFGANVQKGTEATNHGASYQYSHGLSQTGDRVSARDHHRLGYSIDATFSQEWKLRLAAAFDADESENDGLATAATGETLSAILSWRRSFDELDLNARAGPSVGLIQPDSGPSRVSHGAQGGVSLTRPLGAYHGNLSYAASYGRDLSATGGWTVVQTVTGALNGRLGPGNVAAQAQLAADRRQTEASGAAASRGISVTSSYQWYRHAATLQVGIQDGTTGAVQDLTGDGLFIPAPFDSHSRFVSGALSSQLLRHLSGRVAYRYSSTDLPDRPSYSQGEVFATLGFDYGALRLSVEDRYSVTETAAGSVRVNQVFLRASRAFGSAR